MRGSVGVVNIFVFKSDTDLAPKTIILLRLCLFLIFPRLSQGSAAPRFRDEGSDCKCKYDFGTLLYYDP